MNQTEKNQNNDTRIAIDISINETDKYFNNNYNTQGLENPVNHVIAGKNQNTFFCLVGSFFIALIFLLSVRYIAESCLTYDTSVIRALIKGDITGKLNPYVMFINFVFSKATMALYEFSPNINWFSLLIIASLFFPIWALVYKTISTSKSLLWKILAMGVILGGILLFYGASLIEIGFTDCASFGGVIAVIYLMMTEEVKMNDIIIFVLLMIICFGLRFNVFLELSPFFFVAVAVHFKAIKEKKALYIPLVCGVLAIGMMYVIDHAAYKGEYARQVELNALRAQIQDYNGWVNYNEYAQQFSELGIDALEYKTMKICWGLTEHYNKDTLTTIISFNNEKMSTADRFRRATSLVETMIFKEYSVGVWILLGVSFLTCVFFLIRKKEYRALITATSIYVFSGLEMAYLAWGGRTPARVTRAPLALAVFCGVIILFKNSEFDKKKQYYLLSAILIIMGVFCIRVVRGIQSESMERANDIELVRYMQEDTEHIYCVHGLREPIDIINPSPNHNLYFQGWFGATVQWGGAVCGGYDDIWTAIANRPELRFIINRNYIDVMISNLEKRGFNCTAESEVVVLNESAKEYSVWRIVNRGGYD